jgi:hypothetical protein
VTDPAERIAGFVAAGITAQKSVDAAVAGSCYALTRGALERALAIAERAHDDSQAELRVALRELDALGRALRDHFDRLGVRSRELDKAGER